MPEIQSTQSILPDTVPAVTPRINLVDKDPETLQIQPIQTTSSSSGAAVSVNLDETAANPPPLGRIETSLSAMPTTMGDLNPAILSSQALTVADRSSVSSLPIQPSANAGQQPSSGLILSPDTGLPIPAQIGITTSPNPVTEHY